MSNGRPKDPLARFTGATTTGPVTPRVNWNQIKTLPRLYAEGLAAPTRVMFDRNYANQLGGQVGDVITRYTPALVRPMAAMAPAVETVGGVVKKATGISDFQEAGDDFARGNLNSWEGRRAYAEGFGNILEGAGYLLSSASAGGGLARAIGARSLAPLTSLITSPINVPARIPVIGGRTFSGPGALLGKTVFALSELNDVLRGEGKQPAPPSPQGPLPPMGPTVTAPDGRQYAYNPVTGLNEVVGLTTVDDQGRAYRYNQTTGINEVVGLTEGRESRYLPWEQDPRNPQAVASGRTGGLNAAQQLQYDMQLRDLDRETDALIQELQGSIGTRRRQATETMQRMGREGSGASQEIASELAQMGLDVSPGQYDVALEDIARDTALKQAQERRDLANFISSVGGRVSAAERARLKGREALEVWKLEQEVQNAEDRRKEALALAALGM
jgi:hypothetical protein